MILSNDMSLGSGAQLSNIWDVYVCAKRIKSEKLLPVLSWDFYLSIFFFFLIKMDLEGNCVYL